MMSAPLAGFNAVFFARADFQNVGQMQQNRSTEFFWAGSASQGLTTGTMAGLLYNGYGPPGGLNYDIGSDDPPVMDDPLLEDYNVGQVVEFVVGRAIDQLTKCERERERERE